MNAAFHTRMKHLLAAGALFVPFAANAQATSTPAPGSEAPAAVPPAATAAPATNATTDAGGDIIVTAQRRSEVSRDVPITVTTLSADTLRAANVNQLADIAKVTPALRFDSQGPAVQPTIRGVGTAITTSGGGPNVGIYVDGFFQSNTYTSDFSLTRVQNIQVLKGPQGTLFGRNTTGGAILVTTADPSTTPDAEFRASYGRFNTISLQGYGTFGLGQRVAVDLEGLYRRGDGFQTDVLNGSKNPGRFEDYTIRAGLRFQVSDDVSLLLRYTHSQTDDPMTQLVNAYVDPDGSSGLLSRVSPAGQAIYGRTNTVGLPLVYYYAPTGTYATAPGKLALNTPDDFRSRSDIFQGTVRANLGFADLVSYTQYRYDNSPYHGDLDATAVPLFQIFVGPVDRTFSQEFLLSSHPGSRLQYTVGLNYYQIRDTWDVDASFGGSPFLDFGGSSAFTKSYAGFADLTYRITDKLFVTAGARYSHDIVTDAYFKTNFSITSYEGPTGNAVSVAGIPPETRIPVADLNNDSVTPRFVLRYKPDQDSSIYGSFTRGYKAGLLNVGGLSQVPVRPETINAFELGYKFDNRRFALELAGFYYDYRNLQVSSFQNGAAQIRNAASSEIYGLEGQARYRFSRAFDVSAGAAYTHARYKSFTNAPFYSYCDPAAAAGSALVCGAIGPGSLTQTTVDASGFHMQRAPSFTGNAAANYHTGLAAGQLTLSGNLYYTSSFYFDPSQQFRQDGYATLALRAQWVDPSQRFTLAVYGDNVTNHRFRTQVLFNTLGIASVWNAPVTYGASVSVRFR